MTPKPKHPDSIDLLPPGNTPGCDSCKRRPSAYLLVYRVSTVSGCALHSVDYLCQACCGPIARAAKIPVKGISPTAPPIEYELPPEAPQPEVYDDAKYSQKVAQYKRPPARSPEQVARQREKSKAWQQANPEKMREYKRRQRARERGEMV